jgi:NTE family protein
VEALTRILVTDGGRKVAPEPKPKHDWARHAYRTLSAIDTQVRNLRKRQIVAAFVNRERDGTYWGIRGHIGDYGPPVGSLPCPDDKTIVLGGTGTRLAQWGNTLQERMINSGYAICGRRHAALGRTRRTPARRISVSRRRRWLARFRRWR